MRRLPGYLATPFVITTLLAGPAAAETFKDWQVNCTGRQCQAVGLANTPDAKGYLTIRRQHDTGTSAEISFFVADPAGTITGRPYFLRADGRAIGGFTAPVTFDAPEEEGGLMQARLSSDDTARLALVLRRHHALQLQAADGSVAANVSLAGASASWLYMDDRLGRDEAAARPAT